MKRKPRVRVPAVSRYSHDMVKPGVKYDAFTEDGDPILGTLEEVLGRANVHYFEHDGRQLVPEFIGETTVFWDGQETKVTPEGKDIYLSRAGEEFTIDQLWFEPI